VANRYKLTITKVAQLQGHKDAVYDFVFDKSSRKLYSVGADGYVVEWSLDRPEEGKLILKSGEAFYSVGLDEHLNCGSKSGLIYAVNLQTNQLENTSQHHNGGVFFASSRFTGGEDGVLHVNGTNHSIATESLRCLLETQDHFLIGASDNNIYALDKTSFEVIQVLRGHTNSVFALELLDENTLVSTGRDATIKAWDLTIFKEVHSVAAHNYQVKSLSYNGNILLSSSMDKTIKIWNDKLELQKVIDLERNASHTNCINKVEWVDENMFVSCSDDRSLILWQVEINS
jgi:WD40 repeat protein